MKNIMNKLTLKHMVTNKKRTLVTILGIIISVAMFTAVTTGAASVMGFFQRMEMDDSGYWHVEYQQISMEAAKQAASEGNTENIALSSELGYAMFPQSTNEDRPYIYLMEFDANSFTMMNINLIEGRLPENNKEVVIQRPMQKAMDQPYQIGDTIDLTLGTRFTESDGIRTELNQSCWYQSGQYKDQIKESFEETQETRQYTIVGIIERPSFENYEAPGYTVITKLDTSTAKCVNAKLFLSHIKKSIFEKYKEKGNDLGAENVTFNYSALMYYGVTRTDSFNKMMTGMEAILIVIIMVGAVSLIYNSFAISISERSKQFGMLSSIGSTTHQQMHAVLFEGFICGCISIPIGILSGILGIDITFRLIGPMLKNTFEINQTFKTVVSGTGILVSVFVSIITILISAYIPARKASKITAMEAIRQQKDIKLTRKTVKTHRLTRKIFGLEGELAMKSLKRNRRRYRAIVLSLGISIILFISVNAYTYYLSKAVEVTNESNEGDITVGILTDQQVALVLPKLNELDTLSDLVVSGYVPIQLQLPKEASEPLMTSDLKNYLNEIGVNESELNFETVVIDDEEYEKLLEKNGLSALDVKEENRIPVIICNLQRECNGYSMKDSTPLSIQRGQTLDVSVMTYYEETGITKETDQIAVIVEAVTTNLPLGTSYITKGQYIQVIVSKSNLPLLMNKISQDQEIYYRIYGNTSNPQGINEQIMDIMHTELPDDDVYISNRAEDETRSKQLITIFNVFAYGFITLISLISIANMCNTISTSFAMRRREFAMIKSVGMEPHAFQKMIIFESILYGVKALIFGLPVGAVFNYLIYKRVSENFSTDYVIPYHTYIIAIISVFIIVGAAMLYSTGKTRKDNIIDGLKSEII